MDCVSAVGTIKSIPSEHHSGKLSDSLGYTIFLRQVTARKSHPLDEHCNIAPASCTSLLQ
eukprot:m.1186248 g.1186248  ORF g.1186248 m.1186248 type:complete len:60 (+) comp24546_c0_seq23:5061-5240(+)